MATVSVFCLVAAMSGSLLVTAKPTDKEPAPLASVQVQPQYSPQHLDPGSQRTSPRSPSETDNQLEHDLESARPGVNNQDPQTIQLGAAKEDDIDIQLLYDLIRAVEYEANAHLFEKVLNDLDNANYPVPAEAQHIRQPAVEVPSSPKQPGSFGNDFKPIDGDKPTMAIKEQKVDAKYAMHDNKGHIVAMQKPTESHVPLHKRLSAVLREVPQSSDTVVPHDGLDGKHPR